MEKYVYLSIIFFSLIIVFLYVYIIYEKMLEAYNNKRKQKYFKKLVPYVNHIISEIIDGKVINSNKLENLKLICVNKYKREIVEKRLLFYFENSNDEFLLKLTDLCQKVGIIQYEIKNLKSNDNFKKALAAKRLGEFRSKRSIGTLLYELNTANCDVKYNILLALAKIGDEYAFTKAFESIKSWAVLSERSLIEIVDSFEGNKNKIYKHMINSPSSFIACVFIKSAGNFKNESLSEEISKYLFSEDKELKIAAVKALGNIGDIAYLNDLINLLEDDEWEIRAVSAKALQNFKEENILNHLVKALSDQEWYVRFNAATSILNHSKAVKVISKVFEGEDKFAKDIIISIIENSNNNFNLYEASDDPDKAVLAIKIKEYIMGKNKEADI